MTLEHRSLLRPGRVYQRQFDHDEARALLAAGWSMRAVAERMGVSFSRIQQISSPEARAKAARRTAEFHAAICDDCGEPCTHNWSSKHGRHDRVVCKLCDVRRRSEDRLLERMNEDGDILCNRCGQHKPPESFRPKSSGMPHSECRDCGSQRRQAYRQSHREADRAWYRERARKRREDTG